MQEIDPGYFYVLFYFKFRTTVDRRIKTSEGDMQDSDYTFFYLFLFTSRDALLRSR